MLFVKFSLEVHIVRLRSPLPKIIENIAFRTTVCFILGWHTASFCVKCKFYH